mmetsp:Transcript_49011/g.137188  ORF Transcript_49011/g.137188 Transcript_49011/m.137188 type:complete len:356 (+) Transcript_49011:80-1147(+)|eukprot:CAMPEP_0117560470 /NCGR_PEP_ID=MMETSP0784-20121206/53892_1 /TAXON_ID=39447 /ORGANISM="" /LENGTH=355 /DNA_ID=CAMNT_0005357879 /DNA_START=72 /DNA_END=1139 /DNA_ORIENTATION=-
MGNVCQAALVKQNENVAADFNCGSIPDDCTIHMIICALDYKRTSNPLTCTMDGDNMKKLAQQCAVEDLTVMYDEECTSEKVEDAIRDVASRVNDGDYFVFYYSGHGTSVDDEDGDEADGSDEAFCFVDPDGQISRDTIMTDDEFASIVSDCVPTTAKILILTDCCHSGTIADLKKSDWQDHAALSIAGCMDSQTSGDVGTGGIFSHSMLLAIQKIQEEEEEYSAGLLYNTTLAYDNAVFNSKQDITIQCSRSCRPDTFAWPLVPTQPYKSPMAQAISKVSGEQSEQVMTYGAPGEGGLGGALGNVVNLAMANPQLLQQAGINPALAQLAASGMSGDIDVQSLMQAGASSGACAVM